LSKLQKKGQGKQLWVFFLTHDILKQSITTASRSVTHISDEVSKHKISFWVIATMKVLYNIKQ